MGQADKLKKLFIIIVGLFLACESPEEDFFLGCLEVDNGEVCAYCDEWGIVEVTGDTYGDLFILCEDWCHYTSVGKQLDGCKEYLKKHSTSKE